MNKTLYLIRGLPGSGKSSYVKQMLHLIKENVSVEYFEADQYFYKNGSYQFKAEELGKAHYYCQTNSWMAMESGVECVFVSNTFTTEKEMKPYLEMAKEFNYTIVSLIVENRHGNQSVHNVPEETMLKMENRSSIKLKG